MCRHVTCLYVVLCLWLVDGCCYVIPCYDCYDDIRTQYFWQHGWRTSCALSAAELAATFRQQMPGLQFHLKVRGADHGSKQASTSTPYIMAAL